MKRALHWGALALGALFALDALLLACGTRGLFPFSERRLALDAALAAIFFALALCFKDSPRALMKPLGAFLLSLALFTANTRPLWSGDTEAAFLLPFALARHGTFSLSEVACQGPRAPPMYAAVAGRGGKLWSRYPILTGLFAVPLELPAALSNFDPCSPRARDLEKICAALLAALTVALLSSALRTLVPEATAALALFAWTLGTAVLPTLGQALWQHTGAALGAAWAIRALILSKERSRALGVGLGAGAVFACRPPDLPITLALLAALALLEGKSPKRLFHLALACACAAALSSVQIAYQWQAFLGPLRSGYGDEAVLGWTPRDAPLALLGLLFSPARGLLVWSPLLILALVPVLRPPRIPFATAIRPLALGLAAQLLVISCWWAWHGGSSFGPRMHAGGLPLFAPLLALAFAQLQTARTRGAAIVLTLFSILPNALITFVPAAPIAAEATLHLRARGGPWSPLAWPPWGYIRH